MDVRLQRCTKMPVIAEDLYIGIERFPLVRFPEPFSAAFTSKSIHLYLYIYKVLINKIYDWT